MPLVKLSVGSVTLGKWVGPVFKVGDAHTCPPVMPRLDKGHGETPTPVHQEPHATQTATKGRVGASTAARSHGRTVATVTW